MVEVGELRVGSQDAGQDAQYRRRETVVERAERDRVAGAHARHQRGVVNERDRRRLSTPPWGARMPHCGDIQRAAAMSHP